MPDCKPGDLAVIVGPATDRCDRHAIGHFCRIVRRAKDDPTAWVIDPPVKIRGETWNVCLDSALQPIRPPGPTEQRFAVSRTGATLRIRAYKTRKEAP